MLKHSNMFALGTNRLPLKSSDSSLLRNEILGCIDFSLFLIRDNERKFDIFLENSIVFIDDPIMVSDFKFRISDNQSQLKCLKI